MKIVICDDDSTFTNLIKKRSSHISKTVGTPLQK